MVTYSLTMVKKFEIAIIATVGLVYVVPCPLSHSAVFLSLVTTWNILEIFSEGPLYSTNMTSRYRVTLPSETLVEPTEERMKQRGTYLDTENDQGETHLP